ncbi:hypothetical protein RJ641_027272 [Dillenia turbinata]|uniref:Uncharacterized protein n=1 Tax=Dillenia turbinata TaxID=194707 RepID=A0AAN8ZQ65_9MAGN
MANRIRNSVLLGIACYIWAVLLNDVVEASHEVYPHLQSLQASMVNQIHRTAYHFQPPRNWINGFLGCR